MKLRLKFAAFVAASSLVSQGLAAPDEPKTTPANEDVRKATPPAPSLPNPTADAPPAKAEAPPPPKAEAPPPPPEKEREHHRGDRPGNKPDRPDHHRDGPEGPPRKGPELKPTPYLGLMTHPVEPELGAQAGLEAGFGLVVREIMPDSPAAAAGIKKYDILVQFGDQRVVNVEQVNALVRAAGKDKEVPITLRRAGQDLKVTIKIGEKMLPQPSRWHDDLPDMRPFMNDMRSMGEHFREQAERWGKQAREHSQGIQDRMKFFQDRFNQWMGDDRGKKDECPEDLPRTGKHKPEARPRGEGKAELHHESHAETQQAKVLIHKDERGEFRLTSDGRSTWFFYRPAGGEEQKFDISRPEGRKTVPQELHATMEMLERQGGKPMPQGDGKKKSI